MTSRDTGRSDWWHQSTGACPWVVIGSSLGRIASARPQAEMSQFSPVSWRPWSSNSHLPRIGPLALVVGRHRPPPHSTPRPGLRFHPINIWILMNGLKLITQFHRYARRRHSNGGGGGRASRALTIDT